MRPRKIAGAFLGLLVAAGLVTGGITSSAQAAAPAPVAPSVTTAPALDFSKVPAGAVAPKGNPSVSSASKSGFSALTTSCSGQPLGACFSYAGKRDHYPTAPADGAGAATVITKPAVLSTDFHSLWEFTVESDDGSQIVEIGTTVDLAVCGSAANTPCLFSFRWVNNVPATAYNLAIPTVGCAPYCMGASLAGIVGQTKSFSIVHFGGANAGWYLAFDGAYRGAYLDTDWTGATPPATFVQSEFSQAFNEVAAGNDPTQTDMASGVLANSTSNGTLTSGYQYVIGGVTSAGTWDSTITTAPDRWALTDVNSSAFRSGGPGGNENLPTVSPTCSGVGISPTWGGYGSMCPYGNTSAGVPISPVNVLDKDATVARNTCMLNFGKLDGITTSPIRVFENSSYVKWAWFRDANCAGAHIDLDYDKTVLPAGWTNLDHASLMRWSTPVVNH